MHPELIELQALAAGILDPSRQRAVDEHLGSCAECARKYVEVFLGRTGQAVKRVETPAAAATPVASPSVTPPAVTPPAVVAVPTPAPAAPAQAPLLEVSALVEPEAELESGTLAPPAPLDDEFGLIPLPPVDVPPLPAQPWQAATAPEFTVAPLPFGGGPATPPPAATPPAVPVASAGLPDPVAQAAVGSERLHDVARRTPVLAEALRGSGMTHIARALTPAMPQPAVVPITAARSAAPSAPAPRRTTRLIGIAAAALLVLGGGGALAYRSMVSAARAEALRTAGAPASAPVPAAVAAPAPAAPTVTAAADSAPAPAAQPAAVTTSGGTVATGPAPATPAPAKRPASPVAARDGDAPATPDASLRQARVALPSVSLDGVDEAGTDRLNARSTSRAAASDLQRSAGWATSRTAKP